MPATKFFFVRITAYTMHGCSPGKFRKLLISTTVSNTLFWYCSLYLIYYFWFLLYSFWHTAELPTKSQLWMLENIWLKRFFWFIGLLGKIKEHHCSSIPLPPAHEHSDVLFLIAEYGIIRLQQNEIYSPLGISNWKQ